MGFTFAALDACSAAVGSPLFVKFSSSLCLLKVDILSKSVLLLFSELRTFSGTPLNSVTVPAYLHTSISSHQHLLWFAAYSAALGELHSHVSWISSQLSSETSSLDRSLMKAGVGSTGSARDVGAVFCFFFFFFFSSSCDPVAAVVVASVTLVCRRLLLPLALLVDPTIAVVASGGICSYGVAMITSASTCPDSESISCRRLSLSLLQSLVPSLEFRGNVS